MHCRIFEASVLVLFVLNVPVRAADDVRFSVGPKAVQNESKVVITFAVSRPTDVEVAVLNVKGNVVRHLAAGVLGRKNPPPTPLKPGLKQRLE